MKHGLLRLALLSGLLGAASMVAAQPRLPHRLLAPADTVGLGRVLARPAYYHLQISLVRIRRDAQGLALAERPVRYRVCPREYFYPASAVKLAAATLTLEKLERLQAKTPRLNPDSPMRTDSAFAGQTQAVRDTSAVSGRPSLGHYLRKVLIVSDNDAFNRLYEFVGPKELNAGLRRLGLRRARLVHRLSVGDGEPSWRHTNPIRFFADTAETQLLLAQPAASWGAPVPVARVQLASMHIGQAYLNGAGQRVDQPLDLSQKNVFSLPDLQRLLQAVVLPETVPSGQRLHLTPASYARLREALSQLPPQSRSPRYDSLHYPGTYAKFLIGGGEKHAYRPACRYTIKLARHTGSSSTMPTWSMPPTVLSFCWPPCFTSMPIACLTMISMTMTRWAYLFCVS